MSRFKYVKSNQRKVTVVFKIILSGEENAEK